MDFLEPIVRSRVVRFGFGNRLVDHLTELGDEAKASLNPVQVSFILSNPRVFSDSSQTLIALALS